MEKLSLVLVFFLAVVKCYADDPRVRTIFSSENKRFELRFATENEDNSHHRYGVPDIARWDLVEVQTKQKLYSIKGDFMPKTAYISNDGQSIAVVDDWSIYEPTDELVVLSFYSSGQLVKEYPLRELLCSSYSIHVTVSHFQWFFELVFSSQQQKLTIKTFELNTLEFSMPTGTLLKKVRHPSIKENTLLVYGRVQPLGGDVYEMEVSHRVYGKVPASGKIRFRSVKKLEQRTQLAQIEEGHYVENGYAYIAWRLNDGSYRLETAAVKSKEDQRELKKRKLRTCL